MNSRRSESNVCAFAASEAPASRTSVYKIERVVLVCCRKAGLLLWRLTVARISQRGRNLSAGMQNYYQHAALASKSPQLRITGKPSIIRKVRFADHSETR